MESRNDRETLCLRPSMSGNISFASTMRCLRLPRNSWISRSRYVLLLFAYPEAREEDGEGGRKRRSATKKTSSWTFPPGPHLSPLPLPASYQLRNELIEPTRLMGFLSGFYRSRTKNALSCRRDLGRVPNRRRRWRSQFSSCLRSCRRFLGTRSTSGRAKIATSARCGARRDGFSTLV